MIDVVAMSLTARTLGYGGAAEFIEREHLTAFQVARMFLSGAAADRGRIAAVVLLAGATARHHHDRANWDGGEIEKQLALSSLKLSGDLCLFDHCAETARRIIQAHVSAISYRVKSASRDPRRRKKIGFESLVPDYDSRRGARH